MRFTPHGFSGLVGYSLLLVSLWTSRAVAQELAPSDAPALSTPPSPAPLPPTEAVASRPRSVIPSPAEVAWRELHSIQQQEEELWQTRGNYGVGLPITGIVTGIPLFAVLVPIGSILIADSRSIYDGEEDSGSGRERRIGRTLLAFGCLGGIALTAGAYALAKLRRRHHQDEARLESLASRRTLLEQLLEAEWKTLTQRP